MKPGVWKSLEAGGVVLTAQARLARGLRAAYDQRQQAAGRLAWPAPAILPLDAWLEHTWAACGNRLLLAGAQEQRLWEAVIAADAPDDDGLPLAAAAETAIEAWRRAQAWGADFASGEWEASEDTAAFRRWALRFAAQCQRHGWITAAELAAAVTEALRAGRAEAPRTLWLAGFDTLAPRQSELLEALRAAGSVVAEADAAAPEAAVSVLAAGDRDDELAQAAQWARQQMEADPDAAIGIVVPDLGARRGEVERQMMAALHPGRGPWENVPRAFHLSLGPALAEAPLVGAALAALETWRNPRAVELGAALAWMRSPFLGAAEAEAETRAQLEQTLRRRQQARWSWAALRGAAAGADCAALAAAVRAVQHARAAWLARQDHHGWAASFAGLWEAMGWPGERSLGSAEFQAAQAWQELLEGFAALDDVSSEPVTAAEARRRLRQMAARRIFQPRAASAPVEVMGWLEAAGQRFTHLWIAGLDDTGLPAAAAPHPFLPLAWQRRQGLPHSSPAQEAAFAARLWQRLRCSAPVVIASFAARAGDEPLRPSPVLAGCGPVAAAPAFPRGMPPVPFEEVADALAPPLPAAAASGGSSIFKEQLACPFRADLHVRLRAKAAPALPLGLAATTRGQLLHDALRVLWSRLQSRQRLLEMPAGELEAAIARTVDEVVAGEARLAAAAGLAELERERLRDTLRDWLELERQRSPFRTLATERRRQVAFGGLDLEVQLDRVDELEDGGLVLLDYKSGAVSLKDWRPEPRLREPQLPLYWATHPQRGQIEVVAFAQVKQGDLAFKGKERNEGALLGKKLDHSHHPLPWPEQTAAWQAALEHTAVSFRQGVANVDPMDVQTCRHCDLQAVCRIAESDAGADGDDGEDGDGD